MSEQNPTPQWYAPRGGTATDPRPTDAFGQPTTPVPVWPSTVQGPPTPPPARGPGSGQRPGRRVAELTTVAVLAALLASGGTVAADRLWSDAGQAATTGTSEQQARDTDAAPVVQADASAPNWTATAAAVSPSVVAITATSGQGGGQGSGVIIDAQGHVLTNNHVVAGAQQLTVTTSDGRTFEAEIRGTDPSTDLAVITIAGNPSNLTPVAVGDDTPASAAGLKVGDVVTAVGGERVESALSLVAHIRERSAGDEVTLTVLRDGTSLEVTATLAAKTTS